MPMNTSTATRSDETRQRVKALTDKLEAGVKDVFESGSYRAYLQAVSKFHRYSFGNVMLIVLQFPEASVVAGYRAWQKNFGRTVKKGEHGIQILAPQQVSQLVLRDKLDPRTGQPVIGKDGRPVQEWAYEKRTTFRPAYVFDISQTEGKPLPEVGVSELIGDVPHFDKLFAAVRQCAPVEIAFRPPGEAKGCFDHVDRMIYINEGMSEMQTIKTAIHETAHAILHDYGVEPLTEQSYIKEKHTREVEAESVAYVVCQHFGLDTSDYSFSYVASWSQGKELAELKASLDCIGTTAAELIDSIETLCPELSRELKPTKTSERNASHRETHFEGR